MTNIDPAVAPLAAEAAAAVAPSTEPAVELTAAEWKDRFEREVKGRQAERNLYRPAMDAFEGLHADDIAQLRELGKAVARGDAEYITEWGLQTVSNVNGGLSPAEIIAKRQAATPNGATDISTAAQATVATPAATSPVDVKAAIAEVLAEVEAAKEEKARIARTIESYNTKMDSAGIERGSEAYYNVIDLTKAFKGDIDRAIRVHNASSTAETVGVAAAAAAAAGIPAPAPAGAPSSSTPAANLTPREKVKLRLSRGGE